MTENIEPTPASAISKLSDIGEMIERALVSEDELTREVGAIALELTQAMCEALAKVPEWIGVEERLPEPFVSVLVQMPGEEPHPTVREGFISDDGIWCAGHFKREPDEVTHWAKMPEPPKGRSAT